MRRSCLASHVLSLSPESLSPVEDASYLAIPALATGRGLFLLLLLLKQVRAGASIGLGRLFLGRKIPNEDRLRTDDEVKGCACCASTRFGFPTSFSVKRYCD
jgi:hypothetical protein